MIDDPKDQRFKPADACFVDPLLSERIITALNLRGFGVRHVSIEIHPQEAIEVVISTFLTKAQAAALLTALAIDQRNDR